MHIERSPASSQEVTLREASLVGTEPLVAHPLVEGSSSVVRPLGRLLVMALVVGTLAHRGEKSSMAVEHSSSDGAVARFANMPSTR